MIGAPFDGGTTYRAGARFGPLAIRTADYIDHEPYRPSLALGIDPLSALGVVDAGDVRMPQGDIEKSVELLERAVTTIAEADAIPIVLGGDHTIAPPDVTGVANKYGHGRVSVIHFDAHADTAETTAGLLLGHGTPMRRLIDSGAARGDRFLQVGPRGYSPDSPVLEWMREQGMHWFEMTEVVERGLDACVTEAFERAMDDCDGVFLSIDVDVVDPGMAPAPGRSSRAGSRRESCSSRAPLRPGGAGGGAGRSRGVAAIRWAGQRHGGVGESGRAGGAVEYRTSTTGCRGGVMAPHGCPALLSPHRAQTT